MKKGLTLIEIILTLSILGIILITIYPIFNTGLSNINRAGKRTSAVSFALNDLRNRAGIPMDDIPTFVNIDEISSKEVKGYSIKGLGIVDDVIVEIKAFFPKE